MADDYNYELDIYDDDSLEDTQTNQNQSTQVRTEDNYQNRQAQPIEYDGPQQGGKWQVLPSLADPDTRPVEPNATTALSVTDLDWWTTEEDVRGWAAEAGVELELREVTFNEHKANGKSRGAVYLEFLNPQSATAVKQFLARSPKYTVTFFSSNNNPYKMVPKDPVPRAQNNGMRGNNRGGRGGYVPRGGGYARGGANMQYNGNQGNNMNMNFNPMGMFGFGRGMPMNMRGMPNRGGRGGMDFPIMPFNGFGQGFPQPHFNPAFFGDGQQGPGQGPQGPAPQGPWQDGNPHGNKRQRGD